MPSRIVPDQFLVAFSLAGEQRDLVRRVAMAVESKLGEPNVFFDEWFEHYIAGADADIKLQRIYAQRAQLVVVCVSAQYGGKPWTMAEHEAIRSRTMRARLSGTRDEDLTVLPIRVGDGEVDGIPFTTVAPDIRGRSPEDAAKLILDRLDLICARPHQPAGPHPPGHTTAEVVETLVVTRIEQLEPHVDLVLNALTLYEKRLPAEERYDIEEMVDLIRRHLSTEFGPTWKMYFFVATMGERCVGMLICYEDLAARLGFISYLVARNPRNAGTHRVDVGASLAEALLATRNELGLPPPRFLFEVESPDHTSQVKERRRRLGRLRLFDRLAPFKGLRLRLLDIVYVQPPLQWPPAGPAKPLLLGYVAAGLLDTLRRQDAVEILTWVYTQLYGADIHEDPATRAAYGQHVQQMLDEVVRCLPNPVRLLRCRDLSLSATHDPATDTG